MWKLGKATIKGYLKEYATNLPNTALPRDYKDLLRKQCDDLGLKNIKIFFVADLLINSKILNAFSLGKTIIVFNENWAKVIIYHNDDNMQRAFRMTVGHELTHKNGEYHKFTFDRKNTVLINWVREVRADFGGAYRMLDRNRFYATEAIKYKMKWDMRDPREKEKCENDGTHPSNCLRIKYLSQNNFDEKLIIRIAKDLNYDENDEMVKILCNHYANDVIELYPPPINSNELN